MQHTLSMLSTRTGDYLKQNDDYNTEVKNIIRASSLIRKQQLSALPVVTSDLDMIQPDLMDIFHEVILRSTKV